MNVLLHGCNGRMGQVMTRIVAAETDMRVVAGVDIDPGKCSNAYPVYGSLCQVQESPDILIDFSHNSSLGAILQYGLGKRVPVLICTTGFTPDEKQRMADAAKDIPILNSANMSLGVNLLLSLIGQAAKALHDAFDIEIVEKHHNQKVDSPSGTAIMLAEAIQSSIGDSLYLKYGRHSKTEKRAKREIGIHSVRGGAIVGEHDVIFAGQGETVQISHSALSRDVFAYGAVHAARFLLCREPGLYNMKDVIESLTP